MEIRLMNMENGDIKTEALSEENRGNIINAIMNGYIKIDTVFINDYNDNTPIKPAYLPLTYITLFDVENLIEQCNEVLRAMDDMYLELDKLVALAEYLNTDIIEALDSYEDYGIYDNDDLYYMLEDLLQSDIGDVVNTIYYDLERHIQDIIDNDYYYADNGYFVSEY